MVSGVAGDLEYASTKVEVDGLSGPRGESEETGDGLRILGDDRRVGSISELLISVDVVAVSVGVRDDESVVVAGMVRRARR